MVTSARAECCSFFLRIEIQSVSVSVLIKPRLFLNPRDCRLCVSRDSSSCAHHLFFFCFILATKGRSELGLPPARFCLCLFICCKIIEQCISNHYIAHHLIKFPKLWHRFGSLYETGNKYGGGVFFPHNNLQYSSPSTTYHTVNMLK